MQSKFVLALASIGGVVVIVVVVASQMMSRPRSLNSGNSGTALTGHFTEYLAPDRSLLDTSSLLMTGVSSNVPQPKDIPVLKAIPWTLDGVGREFRRAGAEMSCNMLPVGLDIVQPLAEPVVGNERPLGRQIAFVMDLQIDPAAVSTLPRVTRGAIESYLSSHQMTIQVVYFQNAKGELFFGPQVRAGFVSLASPERSTEPEAMIIRSIKEFRTLGVYWNQKTELEPAKARTLVLAFKYNLQKVGSTASNQEFELIFLHLLPESTASSPKLAVFATSNGRTQLELLETCDPSSAVQTPVVSAHVRFGEFNMMGMYPSNPIVTGVFHKAQLSLPVDSFKVLLEGFASGTARSLTDVLDELQTRGASGDTSGLFDVAVPLDAVPVASPKGGSEVP
ncbi:MAG TPA: hypothetical protein PLR25_21900 [Planctomycetaceae bacterium]|mgnify:CR=1 FL=1|nr:hypothetical protein [Planctomycetaceae bacterium]